MNFFSQLRKKRYFQSIVHRYFVPSFLLILHFSFNLPVFAGNSYTNEVESDVHFKKQLPIYIQHDLGDVSIQGWNQDLIRVKLKKTVVTETEESSRNISEQFGLVSLETPNSIELRVGTPQGTDLLTKLRNRQKKKDIRVDLEIRAPLTLGLTVLLGAEKAIKLNQWKGDFKFTGKQNTLDLTKVRSSSPLNLSCPDCKISIQDSEFSGSILAGNQKIVLKKVKASPKAIMVFSQNGDIEISDTEGNFQMRSQSGSLSSKKHKGDLHAQTESGKVMIDDLDGELDAQSVSGELQVASVRVGKLFEMKSKTGAIQIAIPSDYSGEVNLQTIQGEVRSDFLIKTNDKNENAYGPEIKGRLIGAIGKKNDSAITAFTENGSVTLKKKGQSK